MVESTAVEVAAQASRTVKRSHPSTLQHFAVRSSDKLRYADTDRQGHVNNAVFSTLLETGRVELLYNSAAPLAQAGTNFVIARLELDFCAELTWPGEVGIGTAVDSIGRSSVTLIQSLFQGERHAADAFSIVVLVDQTTRRSVALTEIAISRLSALRCQAD